jgi:small subunit ribosomal protein S16
MVKIRLMRMGAAKRPFYRVVVSDSRSPRDGRFIENIGKYHPLEDPSLIQIDEERALYWLSEGAQPTEQVQNLLKVQGIWERFASTHAVKTPARSAGKRTAAAWAAAAAQAKAVEVPAPAKAAEAPAPQEVEPPPEPGPEGQAEPAPGDEAEPDSEPADEPASP